MAAQDVILNLFVSALLASEFDEVLSDPLFDVRIPISLGCDPCYYCLIVEFYDHKLVVNIVLDVSPVAARAVQFCLVGICLNTMIRVRNEVVYGDLSQ